MRLTQGTFSFLPDLTDAQIRAQVEYCLGKGWAVSIEYTDDPHPRNVYWEMSGWAPKYFPGNLKVDMRARLQDKIMFGSDYPHTIGDPRGCMARAASRMPRNTLRWMMPQAYDRVAWYGRGPHDSYWDRRTGAAGGGMTVFLWR